VPPPSVVRRFTPPRGVTEVRLQDGRVAVVGVLAGDAIELERLDRLVGDERVAAEADLAARAAQR
jgi:hypothetical protein